MRLNKKEAASQQTIEQLLAVSRKHFTLHGYTKTSLEEIGEEAGLTRGAIYHHFKNKRGLFKAVLRQVQVEIGQHVEQSASQSAELWQQLVLGCRGYIEGAMAEENRRILLIDGPAVIEWEEWKRLDNENSVALLEEQLSLLKANGELVGEDPRLIAHMISGALNDLALYLNHDQEPKQVTAAIDYLLGGFRVNHG